MHSPGLRTGIERNINVDPNLIVKEMDLISEHAKLVEELKNAPRQRAVELTKRLAVIDKERTRILSVVE